MNDQYFVDDRDDVYVVIEYSEGASCNSLKVPIIGGKPFLPPLLKLVVDSFHEV